MGQRHRYIVCVEMYRSTGGKPTLKRPAEKCTTGCGPEALVLIRVCKSVAGKAPGGRGIDKGYSFLLIYLDGLSDAESGLERPSRPGLERNRHLSLSWHFYRLLLFLIASDGPSLLQPARRRLFACCQFDEEWTRDRQIDRQTDRLTDRQPDRQTDNQADRQTDRRTKRQTYR